MMSTQRRRSLVFTLALLSASATLARSRTACDNDGLEFDDVPSLTVLSPAVFDGRPTRADDDDDVVEFRVGQFHKGGELFPGGAEERSTGSSSEAVTVAVRVSSRGCATLLRRRRRRRRLLVFLNGSRADRRVTGDGPRPPVYWSTAAPVRFSKRSVKAVRQHSCTECGAYVYDLHDAFSRSCYDKCYVSCWRRHAGEDGTANAVVAEEVAGACG